MKEGNAIVKDWKKRFFILDGDQLSYYRKKGVCIIENIINIHKNLYFKRKKNL